MAYREACAKNRIEQASLVKEKTASESGNYRNKPLNNKEIPVYIADYVMMGYGTGAIMAVPGHDEGL